MNTAQKLNPAQLGFDSERASRVLNNLDWLDAKGLSTGQHRAENAFKLFSKPQCSGQHLFLLSYSAIDTKTLINELLTSSPLIDSDVYDLVYVEDLRNPRKPICLQLPKGQGVKFSRLVTSWLKSNIQPSDAAADDADSAVDTETVTNGENGCHTKSVQRLLKVFKRQPKIVNYLAKLALCLDRGMSLSHPILVNNFVNHHDTRAFPIVYCDNPDSIKLFGDIAMVTEQGSTVANHHLLQPGLLHQANGGVIVLPAERLLDSPELWFELKSSLFDDQIKWTCANSWLDPESIELNVQIILVGDALSYKQFLALDPDITQFFPLIAEVNHQINLETDDDIIQYAGYLQNLARRSDCSDLSVDAICRLMSLSSNIVEHQQKFSLDSTTFTQLIQQSQTHLDNDELIEGRHIEQAIKDCDRRKDRIACYSFDSIVQKQLFIETHGKKIGQINGLSVLETDLDAFGEPSRITAAVYVGNGEIEDVERKVDQAGNIHAKGVAILTSYLHQKFALEEEIPLSANLVFEQSYQGIDGDSAAMASLICLLSAFSKQPLSQGIALTGAMDQFGNVLAVGGINEKIEGYFRTCKLNKLDGTQGVIIPTSNQLNLNLHRDVVDAIAAGDFTIYAIDHIDQAIEICFGIKAGTACKDNLFDQNSLYGIIQHRIEQIHNPAHERLSFIEKVKHWFS